MNRFGEMARRLDWRNLNSRERLLAAVTIGVILAGIYLLLILPKRAEVERQRGRVTLMAGEISQTTATNQILRSKLRGLQEAEKEKKVADEISRKASDVIPMNSELSALLESLTRMARQRQVEVVAVRPDSVEKKEGFVQMNLRIDVRARFAQLGEYLRMLENLPRPVIVETVVVETTPEMTPLVAGHLKAATFMADR